MEKNKGFNTVFGIIIGLLIIVGGVYFAFDSGTKPAEAPVLNTEQNTEENDDVTDEDEVVTDEQECIKNISVNSNDNAINPTFEITGVIDNTIDGCNWIVFEGEGGTAQLYFNSNEGWQEIGETAIIDLTDDNWMKSINNFKINIGFNNEGIGLSDEPLKVVLTEEDPKGDSDRETFEIPLEI